MIKICGLTEFDDASLALRLGADFLGLILTEKSPRCLTLQKAEILTKKLRDSSSTSPRCIGVFVDEPVEKILDSARQLDLFALQIHSEQTWQALQGESATPIIPAIAMKNEGACENFHKLQAQYPAILLDSFKKGQHGGTGKTFDHSLALKASNLGKVFIAGGINPENLTSILENWRAAGTFPYALDLSSGVEKSPGIKDPRRLKEFFEKLNGFFNSMEET